ncbi:MAG TPA: T9SS type A sorting domain-containing protein [Flavobacteriales bacterium]|nr:T9SS type A sorting domain-containing protein [Flavobacteriales bacterium]HMR25838.1 T9SS type A sorting domain-containing protein [Flavobacteriales bacterium]
MLRLLTLAGLALTVYPLAAQFPATLPGDRTWVNAHGQQIAISPPVAARSVGPLRDLPALEDLDLPVAERKLTRNIQVQRAVENLDALPKGEDPALQRSAASRLSRQPLVSFAGQNGSGIPPDPTGSAGPDHYLQCVNTSCRPYTKTGASAGSTFSLASIWPGSTNDGDPIVLYDRHADRWFISQFQVSGNEILFAVSQTNDPTGDYYTYSWSFSQFPDYPKFSIWWDGYYMTSNSTHTAVVFEREKMLQGLPAQRIQLSAPSAANAGFRSVLPADADGDLPPNGTPCYFFNLEDDAWGGVPDDRIKIYEMTTDWATPSNTQVVQSQTLNTDPFDTNFGFGFSNISQPGTSDKLDAVSQILYFRAQHVRFVGHSSVLLCHVVDVNGGNRAGIRWYELRDANDGNFSIHQQGTWSPDNGNRWMASIAMDNQGNIGMGYCHTNPSTTVYPGLRYTGRYASDPLGLMTVPEQTIIDGGGSQTGFNRYGDYSHTALDPNGTTFWFTGEYLSASGQPRTRIASFDLVATVGLDGDAALPQASLNAWLDGTDLRVQYMGAPDDGLVADVIGMDGRIVSSLQVSAPAGSWQGRFPTEGLASGVYFVRVGNTAGQKVQRIVLP